MTVIFIQVSLFHPKLIQNHTFGSNAPHVLPRYRYVNEETANQFSQYGNWYWPNYYPWAYINDYAAPDGPDMLKHDHQFIKGGFYPFSRLLIFDRSLYCINQLQDSRRFVVKSHHLLYKRNWPHTLQTNKPRCFVQLMILKTPKRFVSVNKQLPCASLQSVHSVQITTI